MRVSCIMVPVEYSEHCLRALESAAVWADRLGARLEVIHVWDHPPLVPPETQVEPSGGGKRTLFELIGENAEKEMLQFLAGAKLPAGVTVTHHLETGEPVSAILAAVERRGADLIVISTHGRRGLRHFLMGSVAEKVVRLAPVPVLTVPARFAS
ncbi:MAG: universal stress protein [Myxococcales bacterium]|nr:universal stress protein [Myxococcales bacterium]